MSGTWIRCPNCQHKLFHMKQGTGDANIQIKCSSCKQIVEINLDDDGYDTAISSVKAPPCDILGSGI